MFRSIQWKHVLIYILLILLAVEVVGVFLVQSLEKYHINTLSTRMDNTAELLSGYLERYLYPEPKYQEINDLDLERMAGPEIAWIVILDENATVISTTNTTRFPQGAKLLPQEVVQSTFGNSARDTRVDSKSQIPYMYLAYPVKSEDEVFGIIYLVSSMENIYKTISDTKKILFVATFLALVITGVLGFALSKTITGPIQEVTKRAVFLAQGDFSQQLEVKSNDEIGKLTDTFNFLTKRLKETLDEISDEKEKIEAILTNMADGVVALNEKGEVIHMNPAAIQMLSLDKDLLGENLAKELQDLLNINLSEFLDGPVDTGETLIKTENAILKSIIAPLKRDERIVGHILVLQDITKQHKLEAMRKEFVANVSHELRTPLTTIKSYTETLLDGALEEKEISRQFMGVVNNEADRMTRLVNNLLELSRLNNKETRWDTEPIKANLILKDVISKMAVNIKKKGQTLNPDIPESSPEVFVDRDKIEQVFQNILSNASKYTPQGGEISVKLEQLDNRVKFIFKDSGIGIPQEDIPRIFERFYRVDKTRSRDMGGTGLGLSIAKEIVEAHNGEIDIQSELGKGTQVSITLQAITPVAS